MSVLIDIRYRLEYALLLSIIGFVRLFPLEFAANMSAWMTRKIAPRGKRHQRALRNLEIAYPGKTPEEREAIAMEMWDNIGRVIVETMLIDRILKDPDRIEIEDRHLIERYKGKMGAVIAASMHMGNWELASWPLAVSESKTAAVYRLVKNPYVEKYLRNKRALLFPGGLFGRGRVKKGKGAGYDTARMIGGFLRHSGRRDTASLCFLADLYDRTGVPVPFFGREIRTTPFPAMLVRRLNARLWIGRCVRVGNQSRFRVKVREVKVPRTEDEKADIRAITASMQKQFEDWIREAPGQFMWSNRRFVD